MARKVFRRGREGISPVSEQNSTTTLLGSGDVFQGGSDDISDMGSATINIFSDAQSALSGLRIESSMDDETWHLQRVFTVPARELFTVDVDLPARFFRLSYTNSGSPQFTFQLQTIYHDERIDATPMPVAASAAASNAEFLLEEILRQQIITNRHLAHITGETYED